MTTPRLLAIADLHLAYERNRTAIATGAAYPDDWLIVAGDVGERPEHLTLALETLVPKFARRNLDPRAITICGRGAMPRTSPVVRRATTSSSPSAGATGRSRPKIPTSSGRTRRTR